MQDFTSGGLAALNSVTSLMGQHNAADERASQILQQTKQRQMEKNFEVKSTLAHDMMATDPDAALALFNDGLKPFGVSVTMEQFRPALTVLKSAAKMQQDGDLQGAQLALSSGKKLFTNIQDTQRALEMEQTIRQQQAQSHADTVMRLQYAEQYPEMAAAQEKVNAYRGFQQGSVTQDDLTQLYGTTDLDEIGRTFAKEEAKVKGGESLANMKKTYQTAFQNNPGLAEDVTKASFAQLLKPEDQRAARIQALMMNEADLTPKERQELDVLVLMSKNPALIEAMGLKSAMTDKLRITRELEDTADRLGTLQEHKGVLDAAEGAVASIDPKHAGLDSSKPMTEKAAQTYAKLTTIRLGESQKFLTDNANRIQSLDASVQDSQQQLDTLSRQLVGAPPARKAQLEDQVKDLRSSIAATQAMKRLLAEHNPYQLAAQEAAVQQAPDEESKQDATASLEQMQRQREDDLQTVQDEQARLQRNQRILQGRQTQVERDEDVEQRLNSASSAVLAAVQKGTNYTQAFRQAKDVYGVPADALKKQLDALRSDDLTQARNDFAILPSSAQTPQNAARIGKKYGYAANEVMEGIKTPNTPLVSIGQEKAEAKKVGEVFGEQYTAIQQADLKSTSTLNRLDRMDQLLTGVQTGALVPTITQIQSIAQSFGITVDETLPAKQALEALSSEVALGLRNPAGGAGMPGALSDKDRDFLLNMTPGLGKTPGGNRLIIETGRKLAQRDREVARMARAYRKQHGQFDEGFFDQLQAYSDAHPLFKQPDLSQYQEVRTTKDGRRLGRKADGTIEEIR